MSKYHPKNMNTRAHPRAKVLGHKLQCSFKPAGIFGLLQHYEAAHVHDISAQGLGLSCKQALALGTRIKFSLSGLIKRELVGEVVRVQKTSNKNSYGISFATPDLGLQRLFQHFINMESLRMQAS